MVPVKGQCFISGIISCIEILCIFSADASIYTEILSQRSPGTHTLYLVEGKREVSRNEDRSDSFF
jgi:hypothetical protein